MRKLWMSAVLVLGASSQALAFDVTTPEARRQTLLEYVAGRDDLSRADKASFDKAIRLAFGGKAIKDGTDEGVTVAKSVIAAAIFYGIDPVKAARAAYEAYHDTYRWVPPPLAINYQILAFQGRKPKAAARQLAFDFPRYFNEEIAPDLAAWWDEMLSAGKIPETEVRDIREVLGETRALMRPMLRDRLLQAAEIEARFMSRSASDPVASELGQQLDKMRLDVAHDFKGVGNKPLIGDAKAPFYERYRALCAELGQSPQPKPAYDPVRPPQAKAAPQTPLPPVTPAPDPATHQTPHAAPDVTTERPAPPRAIEPPPSSSDSDGFAPPARDATEHERRRVRELAPAPLPGDPPVALFSGWQKALNATVDAWVGTRYLFGGESHRGIDCSAFVRQVFRDSVGIELPRNSRAQYELGRKVDQPVLKAGDIIFFDTLDRGQVTHVGVFLGDGKFAHASSSKGVTRAVLGERYYQRAYWGGKRILSN